MGLLRSGQNPAFPDGETVRLGVFLGLGIWIVATATGAEEVSPSDPEVPLVVVDPGHGGPDYGARGPGELLEKNLVLQVARETGDGLKRAGYRVVYTRKSDRFVSLAERTEIANRAGGSLFLSVHANSSPDPEVAGVETYFLSTSATDEEALRVAEAENAVLQNGQVFPGSESIVGDILQGLAWTAHLERSSRLASEIQRRLARLPGPSRGVKQAPFVVLMGVNMPAVLAEIGFVTQAAEERRLSRKGHQRAIATALVGAVKTYYEQEELR
jgi:N-acetylmuramoyl-L-alanine amidase